MVCSRGVLLAALTAPSLGAPVFRQAVDEEQAAPSKRDAHEHRHGHHYPSMKPVSLLEIEEDTHAAVAARLPQHFRNAPSEIPSGGTVQGDEALLESEPETDEASEAALIQDTAEDEAQESRGNCVFAAKPEFADTPLCKEGTSIESGSWCTPKCEAGKMAYMDYKEIARTEACTPKPDEGVVWGSALCCANGMFTPETFKCIPDLFNNMDDDKDGKLTRTEFRAYKKADSNQKLAALEETAGEVIGEAEEEAEEVAAKSAGVDDGKEVGGDPVNPVIAAYIGVSCVFFGILALLGIIAVANAKRIIQSWSSPALLAEIKEEPEEDPKDGEKPKEGEGEKKEGEGEGEKKEGEGEAAQADAAGEKKP
eukprot:TRINITY_DN23205_c0_g3_i1.p1 TRINITY_DN23205_c0_g3~~TRINITY_DN23205_c0_g3_i1.p1  ORF type:complete len:367 (-),score=100.58 TRINITY_DN23205_c0_g3_i1:23-1123(-)